MGVQAGALTEAVYRELGNTPKTSNKMRNTRPALASTGFSPHILYGTLGYGLEMPFIKVSLVLDFFHATHLSMLTFDSDSTLSYYTTDSLPEYNVPQAEDAIASNTTIAHIQQGIGSETDIAHHSSDDNTLQSHSTKKPKNKVQLTDQTNLLPFKKLLVVFFGLACCIVTTTLDSTIVATALPTISSYFNAGSVSSWVPSATLLTSTAFQPLYGRFSEYASLHTSAYTSH